MRKIVFLFFLSILTATTMSGQVPGTQRSTKRNQTSSVSVTASKHQIIQSGKSVFNSRPKEAVPLQRVTYYTNCDGRRIQSPTRYSDVPAGATAICRDGTYSFSKNRCGTCSGHRGVARWLK